MKNILYLLLIFVCSETVWAQNISVTESRDVQILMDRYAADNRMSEFVDGWRIQIVSSTDRRKTDEMKNSFIQKFPNIPIRMQHTPPYYKIKAGAFNSKLDAMGLLYIIKKEIPGAYPTKDNKIKPSEMVGIF